MRGQPCEGPPGNAAAPRGEISACPGMRRAASLRKGTSPPRRAATGQRTQSHAAPSPAGVVMSTYPCEGWSRGANLAKARPVTLLRRGARFRLARRCAVQPAFARGCRPSQGCDRSAHSKSRSVGSGWRRDVHAALRGLVVRGQPCEGPPGNAAAPRGEISACPAMRRAASLRKGTPPPQAVSMASSACSPNSAMAISRMTFLRIFPVAVDGKSLTKRI